MTQVSHFGLHWDGPIGWLLQGKKPHNFVGITSKAPFRMPKGTCNHQIPPMAPLPDKGQWSWFQQLMKDPLVKAMLPIPAPVGERAFFVENPPEDLNLYLAVLARLSSPIQPIINPAWTARPMTLHRRMQATNLQPEVITDISTGHTNLVDVVVKSTGICPRTIIFTGGDYLPIPAGIQKIQTSITEENIESLVQLPMENFGATILRRHARGEDIAADMETREERRKRMMR